MFLKYSPSDSLFNNLLLSDITLTASDGTSYPAHRNVLFAATNFFESAVSETSGFAESTSKTVNLAEHPPGAVKAFLEFCYTGSYTFAGSDKATEDDVTPALDFRVYQLADYVLATNVKEYAADMMTERFLQPPHNSGFLPGLVKAVYENTESGQHVEVREVVVGAVVSAIEAKGHAFAVPFLDVMKEHGEFSTAVLERLLKDRAFAAAQVTATCYGPRSACGAKTTKRLDLEEAKDIKCQTCGAQLVSFSFVESA